MEYVVPLRSNPSCKAEPEVAGFSGKERPMKSGLEKLGVRLAELRGARQRQPWKIPARNSPLGSGGSETKWMCHTYPEQPKTEFLAEASGHEEQEVQPVRSLGEGGISQHRSL